MKILWVKAGKILPVNTGGRIRSFNILRHLSRRNDTTFLSYYDGERDSEYDRKLKEVFPNAVVFPSGAPASVAGRVASYLLHALHPAPFAVTKFSTPVVQKAIDDTLSERMPDVVVCDFLAPTLNFSAPLSTPSVLFQHNVEGALWTRQAAHERNPIRKLAFTMEAAKMRRYEANTVRRFDHVIAVSEHDKSLMAKMRTPREITVVPTGVDVMHFREAAIHTDSHNVMFLGSMDWTANIDGVAYFCEEIWPRVIAAVPDAKFHVVGRNPPRRITALASDSIEIVGGVDSLIPHIAASPVFVVPLRIGGGTRLKIYEAMAAERAIVSTTVGAEGLEYAQNEDILIADEASVFADAVIALLHDPSRRRAVGAAAGRTAARFDWSRIADAFENVLRGVTTA